MDSAARPARARRAGRDHEWLAFSGTAVIFVMLVMAVYMSSAPVVEDLDHQHWIKSSLDSLSDDEDEDDNGDDLSADNALIRAIEASPTASLIVFPSSRSSDDVSVLPVSHEVAIGKGLTISAWIWFAAPPAEFACLFSWMGESPGSDTTEKRWAMTLGSDRRVRMTVHTRETAIFVSTSVSRLRAREWFHVAVTHCSVGGARIMINGIMDVSMPVGMPRDLPPFYNVKNGIGSGVGGRAVSVGRCFPSPDDNPANWFRGKMSQIRLAGSSWSARDMRRRMFTAPLSPIRLINARKHSIETLSAAPEPQWVPNAFPKSRLFAELRPRHLQENGYTEHASYEPLDYDDGSGARNDLVVVRPFTAASFDLLEWSLRQWASDGNADPCHYPDSASPYADLVLLFSGNMEELRHRSIEDRISRLVNTGDDAASTSNRGGLRCFGRVRVVSARVHGAATPSASCSGSGDEDVAEQEDLCWLFYAAMHSARIVEQYRYMYFMPTDVHPLRSRWLERVIGEALAAKFDPFWVKGSLQHAVEPTPRISIGGTDPAPMTADPAYFRFPTHLDAAYSITQASLYALGNPAFNSVLQRSWKYGLQTDKEGHPGGCYGLHGLGIGFTFALSQFRAREMEFRHSQLNQHLFRHAEFVVDYGGSDKPIRPWIVLRDFPEAYLVRSKWANYKKMWDFATHQLYMRSGDVAKERKAYAGVVKAAAAQDPWQGLLYRGK